MSHLDTFVYQPLSTERDEIRILYLLPSRTLGTRLEGHLEIVALDIAPQFQSLSYVWGQSSIASEALQLGDRTLEITSNLESALRGVRRRDELLPLWCDRICINQADLEERSHQVHLMRHIFTTTSLVNIWLGADFRGAKAAFAILQGLAAGQDFVHTVSRRGTNPASMVKGLIKIFQYPWWKRLWTIQEALLARRALVHCGSSSIELETIMQAFELLWNQLVQQAGPLMKMCGMDAIHQLTRQLEITVRRLHVTRSLVLSRPHGRQRQFRDDPTKWPMVMHSCAWSDATDARDKVYGTLGLFPSSLLEVDYSLSLRQTYSRSTFAMIQRLSNLAVLTQTVSQVSVDNELPSWVPDWRYPAKETASLLVFNSYFRAGLHLALDAKLLDDEVLQLSAQHMDEILEIGEVYDDLSSDKIGELVPLLKPVVVDWIRMAGALEPRSGSFTIDYTEFDTGPDVGALPAGYQPLPLDQKPTADFVANDGPAYGAPQAPRAPLYKDTNYKTTSLDRGVKRKADDGAPYMAQQSQSAPVYKDAAYQASPSGIVVPQSPLTAEPRSYDPFSHTYGQASFSTPATPLRSSKQARDSGELNSDGTPSSEVFWRTMCMDIVEDRELKKHRRCKAFDSWRVWEWVDWIFGIDGSIATIPQLHWHLTTQLQGKRLVRTKRGYLGLAGRHAQVGDQIWILAGGAYPYVLRSDGVRGEEQMFRCVSTAFVHGFMDGPKGRNDETNIEIKIR